MEVAISLGGVGIKFALIIVLLRLSRGSVESSFVVKHLSWPDLRCEQMLVQSLSETFLDNRWRFSLKSFVRIKVCTIAGTTLFPSCEVLTVPLCSTVI